MAFGDGLNPEELCSPLFMSGDTGDDQPFKIACSLCFKGDDTLHVLSASTRPRKRILKWKLTQDAAEGELFLPPASGQVRLWCSQGRFLKFDVTECDRVQVRESLLWRRNCVVIGRDADIGSIVERPRNIAQLVHGGCFDLNEEEELRQDSCTQKLDVTNCATRPPLEREPHEIKLG